MGKRTLAGVAAGALALGVLTIASAPAASAGKSIKPKATATGAVSAVRAGAISSIPYARLSFSKALSKPTTLIVVTSPAGGRMWIDDTAGAQPASVDDSATLTSPRTLTGVVFNNTATIGTSDDSTVGIAVDTAGAYIGQLANGTDTVTFSFTTTGAPASMTLTPATQTVLVGQAAELAVTVKDSAGNATQIAYGDSIAMSDNSDDTVSPTSFSAGTIYRGTGVVSLATTGNPAGTTTVTATPAGTLPSLGVTAQTATVTKSGTISSSAVVNMTVSTPANAINDPETGNSIARTTQVPANTTNITVAVDDTTANAAGTKLRFGINLNSTAIAAGATVNGTVVTATDDTQYVIVETDASKKANVALTLGGGAINTGAVVTVFQATVAGVAVSTNPKITISELAPQVYPADITVSPDDSVVAKLGDTVPVSVTVDDSFGTPQAGWVIRAERGGVIVNSATTGANGKAALSLTQASTAVNGTVERFVFVAYPPIGASVTASKGTQVTWTTTGGVTSLTVTASANTPTSLTDVAQTSTKGGAIVVPAAGVLSGAPTAVQFTIATGVDDTTAGRGNYAQFSAVTSPLSSITYTTPAGVFVTDDTTTATWANGEQTITVASTTPVYVYATKTGVHDVVITSGGKTVTAKVKASTSAANAYNIALTPAKQTVGSGAIGTATLKVTDIFGNPVQTSTTAGYVSVTASGEVLLAGYDTNRSFTTNASGEATITIIAGVSAGAGLLTAVPATGDTATAWQTSYTKPTGAPAPVTSATAEVTVGASPVTKSITITGSRTTVGGKPGVMIDGITVGIEDGKTVIPYFRFPGQTSYTQGLARPVITDDEFTWQRKTGKKFYAYVTSDDGAVKSNNVIIAAN
ncbi:MAG: hypothetical protein FJW85_03725 [Actinobacteria bacterium]|nr:hypothetical protein [Actinomycetota bacterium]